MATGDIREIDMTKATNLDGKKIRLVGDDGKGYWIEKEDLAAVVGELLPIANDNINGLLGKDLYQKVNIINASYGLYGGTNTTWYRIGKYNYYLPSAVIIYMFHGQSGSIKSKFEISINFSGEKSVIVYGTAKSVVGYVHTGDGKVEIYVKVSPGYCFTALVAGGNIDNTDRYTTTTEPVGIVYIP